MRPAMMRRSVDLPEPERPRSPTISPLRSVRLTSSNTITPPPLPRANCRETFSTRRTGSPGAMVTVLFMAASSIETQAVFGVAVERPPQDAVEGGDDNRHHGYAEHEAREVALVRHQFDVSAEAVRDERR